MMSCLDAASHDMIHYGRSHVLQERQISIANLFPSLVIDDGVETLISISRMYGVVLQVLSRRILRMRNLALDISVLGPYHATKVSHDGDPPIPLHNRRDWVV